jgi:hypothetical protein
MSIFMVLNFERLNSNGQMEIIRCVILSSLNQIHQLAITINNIIFDLFRSDVGEKLPGAFDSTFFDFS